MSIKIKYNISQWDSLKLNYWGITKAGNTSMKYALLEKCNKKLEAVDKSTVWVHSMKIANYIDRKTAHSNGYKNFSITRNPYDRTLSMYKDFKKRKSTIYSGIAKKFDINSFDDFLEFLLSREVDKINIHFKSQSYFISENGKILVDTFIDINEVEKINKLFDINIPHINKIPAKMQLTNEQCKKINTIYAKDFKLFNYKMI